MTLTRTTYTPCNRMCRPVWGTRVIWTIPRCTCTCPNVSSFVCVRSIFVVDTAFRQLRANEKIHSRTHRHSYQLSHCRNVELNCTKINKNWISLAWMHSNQFVLSLSLIPSSSTWTCACASKSTDHWQANELLPRSEPKRVVHNAFSWFVHFYL